MHIDLIPNRNSPPAILVRESYREKGKVKKRTLANISHWDPEVIAGLRVLLKGGHASTTALEDQFSIERSLPHGHVAAVLGVLRGIGLHTLLERKSGKQRALAMAKIAARISCCPAPSSRSPVTSAPPPPPALWARNSAWARWANTTSTAPCAGC